MQKSEAKTSSGVLNPRQLRGVALKLWAKAVNCAWLTCVRSVSPGKYRRMRLVIFSFAPICHGELGSQYQLLAPIPFSKARQPKKLGTAIKGVLRHPFGNQRLTFPRSFLGHSVDLSATSRPKAWGLTCTLKSRSDDGCSGRRNVLSPPSEIKQGNACRLC